MKRLGTRVNLIPVIAKADTMIPEDLANFKLRVRTEFSLAWLYRADFPHLGRYEQSSPLRASRSMSRPSTPRTKMPQTMHEACTLSCHSRSLVVRTMSQLPMVVSSKEESISGVSQKVS